MSDDDRVPTFANVDLDIESRAPLEPLIAFLEPRGIILSSGQRDTVNYLGFEASESFEGVVETIECLLDVVESLPPEGRALWDQCSKRVFDIGIHSGTGRFQPALSVPEAILRRLAACGAGLALTCYPNASGPASTERFEHFRLD